MRQNHKDFYSAYKQKLFSYLTYKSGNTDVAEDITQDSFIRYFQNYGQKGIVSPALLFTIARNALVDFQRNQDKFVIFDREPAQTTMSIERSLIIKEEATRASNALNDLSEKDRDMLTMAVNGVPYKEIAKVFDMRIGAIKVRIHRSRKKIQKILMKEE